MASRRVGWYIKRLRAMDAREARHRAEELARRAVWTAQVGRGRAPAARATSTRSPIAGTIHFAGGNAAFDTRAADQILDAQVDQLGVSVKLEGRWLTDPLTGVTAPATPSFRLNLTDRAMVGDIRQLWEQSRLQHLPVLAAAYNATGDDRYAERCAEHVTTWLAQNPFLMGPNWTSGIELGLRLISFVWTRRLLDGWHGAKALFDDNPVFVQSIGHHLLWLSRFPSVGSSANNHAVAEAAGQYCAATAFPWFEQSDAWRTSAADFLSATVASLTFNGGVNSELASHYHLFTLELVLVALVEDQYAGTQILGPNLFRDAVRMADAMAAMIDSTGRLPRQGDSDDAAVLLFDALNATPLCGLAFATTLIEPLPWWPNLPHDPRTQALGQHQRSLAGRPEHRPSVFIEAGMAILRHDGHTADNKYAYDQHTGNRPPADDSEAGGSARWLRFDFGPHGGTAIAAHAHADALSIELRLDGRDVIADAGTFRYSDPVARDYYRGTSAHSTIEIDGADQSRSAGPFLWSSIAQTDLCENSVDSAGITIRAEHSGYGEAVHRRSLHATPELDQIQLVDDVAGLAGQTVVSRFLLGPEVETQLVGTVATLRIPGGADHVRIELPTAFEWVLVTGAPDGPGPGWYSESYGRQRPTAALVGTAHGTIHQARTEIRIGLNQI